MFLISVVLLASVAQIRSEFVTRNQEKTTFILSPKVVHYDLGNMGTKFSYLICEKNVELSKIVCGVYSSIFSDKSELRNNFHCNLTLERENIQENKSLEIVSVNPFNINKLIVNWLEVQKDIVGNSKYTVLETTTCATKEFSIPINLPKTHPAFVNDIIIHRSEKFDIVVSSKTACKHTEKCLFSCSDKIVKLCDTTPGQIPVNLNSATFWGTAYGEQHKVRSVFVQGQDPSTEKYKLVYMDPHYTTTDLVTLDTQVDHVFSRTNHLLGSSFCQVTDNSKKSAKINCIKYYGDIEVTLNKTFELPEAVKLLGTWTTEHHEPAVLLIAEKVNCTGQECWNLLVSIVYEKKPVQVREVKFDCSGDRKQLAVHVMKLEKALVYGCEKTDENDKSKSYFHIKKLEF